MTQNSENSQDLLDLFAGVCDGSATDEHVRELDELLRQDGRARQLWWEFITVETGITAELAAGASLIDLPGITSAIQAQAPPPESRDRGIVGVARRVGRFIQQYPVVSCTAAALALVMVVAVLALIPPPGSREGISHGEGGGSIVFVANLVRTHEARWPAEQRGTDHGAFLQTGHRYVLDEGFAEIAFRSGAVVILEGPAEFILESRNSGSLVHGKLAAEVSQPARGFHIETPLGRIVDLGTAFGVDAPRIGPMQVHCFRGSISFEPIGGPALKLSAGEAITQEKKSGERQQVRADITQFVPNLRLNGPLRSGQRGMIVDTRFTNNVAVGKPAVQSSTYGPSTPAALATDGNTTNFTHTSVHDTKPSLTIDLLQPHDIDAIIVHNRDDCCGSRLQDVFVEILADDGETILFTSDRLNPGDDRSGPQWLAVGLPESTGDKVRGRYIRIRRQIIPGESRDIGTLGNWRSLSVAEVQVFADPVLKLVPPTHEPATDNEESTKEHSGESPS